MGQHQIDGKTRIRWPYVPKTEKLANSMTIPSSPQVTVASSDNHLVRGYFVQGGNSEFGCEMILVMHSFRL